MNIHKRHQQFNAHAQHYSIVYVALADRGGGGDIWITSGLQELWSKGVNAIYVTN